MSRVAGVDGAPGGWAVVIAGVGKPVVRRIEALEEIFDERPFVVVAVDVPIGLLDAYQLGGRSCDQAVRKLLGSRRSSVFAAPVRAVLKAHSFEEANGLSRASSPIAKGVSKQTYAILGKIREVDRLLQRRPKLQGVVREVHPELCFCQLVGKPMTHRKGKPAGREERRAALRRAFPEIEAILNAGRSVDLPVEDILDATVACWSALRLAAGHGRSIPDVAPLDATGLAMGIWV